MLIELTRCRFGILLAALAVAAPLPCAAAQRSPGRLIGKQLVAPHPIVNGQLYREASAAPVYLAQDQQLFWIPTPDALDAMGFTWNVNVVPDGSLSYPRFSLPSNSPTPPSLVHPPSIGSERKLKPLAGAVPGARRLNFRGIELYVGELRGWLRGVDDPGDGCGDGGDFHYALELDTDWAIAQGIDLHQVLRVGNVAHVGLPEPGSTARQMVSLPLIKLELNAWPRGSDDAGRRMPADWTWMQSCGDRTLRFPFNPLRPGPGSTLIPLGSALSDRGPYVRVSGSLVTDHPHDFANDLGQWLNRVFGFQTSPDWPASVPDWAPGVSSDDPRHPARWTEVHPPDLIELVPNPPAPRVTVRGVALNARSGINSCASVLFNMVPDTPRPSPAAIPRFEELRGPETFFPWGEVNGDGSSAQLVSDPAVGGLVVQVRAKVCGGTWPRTTSPGRFKAIYRVWWQ